MITIHATYRKNIGTGNTRKLRIQNKCPAIMYGKDKPNIPIIINQNILENIERTKNLLQINSITVIVDTIKYIVKALCIQYHPFKKKIIHIDFLYLI